jgi:hypothetical protein
VRRQRTIRRAPAPTYLPWVNEPGAFVALLSDAGITLTSGAVSAWADQSGAGHHVTQGTPGSRPLVAASAVYGGQQAVVFTGAKWLQSAAFAQAQPFTLFVVGNIAAGDAYPMFVGNRSSSGPQLYGDAADTYHVNAYSASGITSAVDGRIPSIIAAVFNGASSSITVNGVRTAGALGAGALDGLTVAALGAGLDPGSGTIVALLGFAGGQTVAAIARETAWAKRKYKL